MQDTTFLADHSNEEEPNRDIGDLIQLQLECVTGNFRNLDETTPKMDPEILSEFLMENGALSVVIEDADKGTELEQPIFNQPSATGESWYRVGTNAVGDNFWRHCSIQAYYSAGVDVNEVVRSVVHIFSLPATPRFTVNSIPDQDWIKVVQQVSHILLVRCQRLTYSAVQDWPPIVIGSLLLRFPWHSEADVLSATEGSPPEHELVLEGGMAFGTGEHPTTQLCCNWLERTLAGMKKDGRKARVLDYGAGSGVLGMAALRFGAAEAVGVEIDRDSILAANANAALNQLHFPCYLPSAAVQGSQAADDVIYAAQIRRTRCERRTVPHLCALVMQAGRLSFWPGASPGLVA